MHTATSKSNPASPGPWLVSSVFADDRFGYNVGSGFVNLPTPLESTSIATWVQPRCSKRSRSNLCSSHVAVSTWRDDVIVHVFRGTVTWGMTWSLAQFSMYNACWHEAKVTTPAHDAFRNSQAESRSYSSFFDLCTGANLAKREEITCVWFVRLRGEKGTASVSLRRTWRKQGRIHLFFECIYLWVFVVTVVVVCLFVFVFYQVLFVFVLFCIFLL